MNESTKALKQNSHGIKRPHLYDIRTNNRSRILRCVFERKVITRQSLAEKLNLTPASVSRITKDLIAQGIFTEAPVTCDGNQRGRPSIELKINPDWGFLVAISISSYSRLISIVDVAGKRRNQKEIPIEIIRSASSTVDFVGDYVDELVEMKLLTRDKIIGAAFGLPGSISAHSGFLTKSIFLEWPEFPIKSRLVEQLGCPVCVENIGDALCLNFLDSTLAANERSSNVFLTHVAAGMGASVAIGRIIVRRLADEGWINDIIVPAVDSNGDCKGKLKHLVSGQAILDKLSAKDTRSQSPVGDFKWQLQRAVQQANKSEGSTRDVFFDAGHILGTNLLALTIACSPDTIVLAGPVAKAVAYADGVRQGYLQVAKEMDIQPSNFLVSDTSYLSASEALALREYFISGAYGLGHD